VNHSLHLPAVWVFQLSLCLLTFKIHLSEAGEFLYFTRLLEYAVNLLGLMGVIVQAHVGATLIVSKVLIQFQQNPIATMQLEIT
jgi:hypothetical protein